MARATFGPEQVLPASLPAASVFAADLDSDGDLDVLSGSYSEHTVVWYENMGGLFEPRPAITTSQRGPISVFAADLDGDGDNDALSAGEIEDTLAWYENADGRGGFGGEPLIKRISTPLSLFAADVNRDGRKDCLAASFNFRPVTWYPDEGNQFGMEQWVSGAGESATSVFGADIDSDGDVDTLAVSDGTMAWFENLDGQGGFGSEQTISPTVNTASPVSAVDLDGDGDVDALGMFDSDEIAWYENLDGQGGFGSKQTISPLSGLSRSVSAADLDGDGDLDVLSASRTDQTIVWYENTDGQGTFGLEQVIGTGVENALSVTAADVDGDGDVDVVSASYDDDKIAWYENTDGQGGFWLTQTISTTADGATTVVATDFDRDGDLDVASASELDDEAVWYENTDGQGSFGPERVIASHAGAVWSIFPADVGGDPAPDLLSADAESNLIAWLANRSGQTAIDSIYPTLSFPYPIEGEPVELLRVDVTHLGRAGDAAEELDTIVLAFDRAPATPLTSEPAAPLTDAEANDLIDHLGVYRDDGSGSFEPGPDILVGTVATLVLAQGIQTVDLANADPTVIFGAGETARFFVIADLSPTASSADPNRFRVRHLSSRSNVVQPLSDVVLSQAPGTGNQPRVVTVPEPALALQLGAGVALLGVLARRRTNAEASRSPRP